MLVQSRGLHQKLFLFPDVTSFARYSIAVTAIGESAGLVIEAPRSLVVIPKHIAMELDELGLAAVTHQGGVRERRLDFYRDDTCLIGDDIEVQVVEIFPDAVRIGVQAPRSVVIWREEAFRAALKNRVKENRLLTPGQRERGVPVPRSMR